jgi:hypothetical protein
MAKPTKLTPEVQRRICDAIGVGATYEYAAAYGGVHYDTLNQWRKTKPAFSEALESAEAGAVVALLAKIQQAAGEGTWQAACWILERRFPDAYGRAGRPAAQEQEALELEPYVRRRAREMGLDEEEAFRLVQAQLRLLGQHRPGRSG